MFTCSHIRVHHKLPLAHLVSTKEGVFACVWGVCLLRGEPSDGVGAAAGAVEAVQCGQVVHGQVVHGLVVHVWLHPTNLRVVAHDERHLRIHACRPDVRPFPQVIPLYERVVVRSHLPPKVEVEGHLRAK